MDIEREVADLYRAVFMRDKIGERYSGWSRRWSARASTSRSTPRSSTCSCGSTISARAGSGDRRGRPARLRRAPGQVVQLGQRLVVDIIDVSLVRAPSTRGGSGRWTGTPRGGAAGARPARAQRTAPARDRPREAGRGARRARGQARRREEGHASVEGQGAQGQGRRAQGEARGPRGRSRRSHDEGAPRKKAKRR